MASMPAPNHPIHTPGYQIIARILKLPNDKTKVKVNWRE